jgi:hypothetical protein
MLAPLYSNESTDSTVEDSGLYKLTIRYLDQPTSDDMGKGTYKDMLELAKRLVDMILKLKFVGHKVSLHVVRADVFNILAQDVRFAYGKTTVVCSLRILPA